MKSIYLPVVVVAILAATFMASCQKRELKEEPKNTFTILDPDGLYSLSPRDKSLAFEKLDLDFDALKIDQAANPVKNSGNARVHGHYSYNNVVGNYLTTTIEFNAIKNKGETNGTMHIWRTWGESGENAFQLHIDVDCIDSDGNNAVISGILAMVTGNAPIIFSVGSRWWIHVRDHGQGTSEQSDQHHSLILMNPSGAVPYRNLGIQSIFWASPFLGTFQEAENKSDIIVVN